jgi:hypothetical protein
MAWNYKEEDNHEDFGEKLPAKTYQAVIFAIYDMGMQKSSYNNNGQVQEKIQHKIRLGIELNKLYETGNYAGERITKYPKFTLSFYAQSRLLPVIRGILGRDMTKEEIEEGGEVLIGKNFALTVSYGKNEDGTEKKFPDYNFGGLMDGIPLINPILTSDYLPEFILKEIREKSVQADIPTQGQQKAKDDAGNGMTKVDMYKAILQKVQENGTGLEWEKDYTAAGRSISAISTEQMQKFYDKYVLGW